MAIKIPKPSAAQRRIERLLMAIVLALAAALPMSAEVVVHDPVVLPISETFTLDDLVAAKIVEGLPELSPDQTYSTMYSVAAEGEASIYTWESYDGWSFEPRFTGTAKLTFTNTENEEDQFVVNIQVKSVPKSALETKLTHPYYTCMAGDTRTVSLDDNESRVPLSDYVITKDESSEVDLTVTQDGDKLIIATPEPGNAAIRLVHRFIVARGNGSSAGNVIKFQVKPMPRITVPFNTFIAHVSSTDLSSLISRGVLARKYSYASEYTAESEDYRVVTVGEGYDGPSIHFVGMGTTMVTFHHKTDPDAYYKLAVSVKRDIGDFIDEKLYKAVGSIDNTLYVGDPFTLTLEEENLMPLSEYEYPEKSGVDFDVDLTGTQLTITGKEPGKARLDFKYKGETVYDPDSYQGSSVTLEFIAKPDLSKFEQLKESIVLPSEAGGFAGVEFGSGITVSQLIAYGVVKGVPENYRKYEVTLLSEDTEGLISIIEAPYDYVFKITKESGNARLKFQHKDFEEIAFEFNLEVRPGAMHYIQKYIEEQIGDLMVGKSYTIKIDDPNVVPLRDYEISLDSSSEDKFSYNVDEEDNSLTIESSEEGGYMLRYTMTPYVDGYISFTFTKVPDKVEVLKPEIEIPVCDRYSSVYVSTLYEDGVVSGLPQPIGYDDYEVTYEDIWGSERKSTDLRINYPGVYPVKFQHKRFESVNFELTVTVKKGLESVISDGLYYSETERKSIVYIGEPQVIAIDDDAMHKDDYVSIGKSGDGLFDYEFDETGKHVTITGLDPGSGRIKFNHKYLSSYNAYASSVSFEVRDARQIDEITLNKTEITGIIGKTYQLTVVTPEGLRSVKWSSSDEGVTTVDQTGLVTFIAGGTATITAAFGETTATCTVTVDGDISPDTKITLNKHYLDGVPGHTFQLVATLEPAVEGAVIEWSSSNETAATVDETGLVTFVAVGSAEVTASYKGLTDDCWVSVSNIVLDPSSISGVVGDEVQITALVSSEDTAPEITWSSSDEKVATVDETGLLSLVGIGMATITATYNGSKDWCYVIVMEPIAPTGIVLNPTAIEGYPGDTEQLTATLTPEGATGEITWGSSDDAIATVDATGLVTLVAEGSATITATCGDLTATCAVTVKKIPPTGIVLNLTAIEGYPGDTEQLTATLTPEGATGEITWVSSDDAIATVDATGLVTLVAEGSATITATCGELTATCAVTVKKIVPIGIVLNLTAIEGYPGDTEQLAATLTPEGATGEITWGSSDDAIATVDATGLVTLVAEGSATITATCGELTATCAVTVKEPITPTGIVLNPTAIEGYPGDTEQLTATLTPEGATGEITWGSSDDAIATVDATGLVTLVAEGSATITATCGELTATCAVTVKKIVPTGIVLNKSSIGGFPGASEQLTATLTPEGATGEITWVSSDDAIATVDATGLVTFIAEGTATITATCGELTATCAVTVAEDPGFTGIDGVEVEASETFKPVYDLHGRVVALTPEQKASLASGIYIQDGKKIYIRR